MTDTMIFQGGDEAIHPKRPVVPAMKRGFAGRCPHCGEGKLFASFVKPVETCSVCHEDLSHQRADDFPAYLNIVIVGHVGVGGFTVAEAMTSLSGWVHLAIWVPIMRLRALSALSVSTRINVAPSVESWPTMPPATLNRPSLPTV